MAAFGFLDGKGNALQRDPNTQNTQGQTLHDAIMGGNAVNSTVHPLPDGASGVSSAVPTAVQNAAANTPPVANPFISGAVSNQGATTFAPPSALPQNTPAAGPQAPPDYATALLNSISHNASADASWGGQGALQSAILAQGGHTAGASQFNAQNLANNQNFENQAVQDNRNAYNTYVAPSLIDPKTFGSNVGTTVTPTQTNSTATQVTPPPASTNQVSSPPVQPQQSPTASQNSEAQTPVQQVKEERNTAKQVTQQQNSQMANKPTQTTNPAVLPNDVQNNDPRFAMNPDHPVNLARLYGAIMGKKSNS